MKKNLYLALSLLAVLFITSCNEDLPAGIFAEIKTNKGDMVVNLFYKQTPITVSNFITLAEGTNEYVADSLKNVHFYDGVDFHRIIKDFVIQGGDRNKMGNPGYSFRDEIVDTLSHSKKGILSMANSGPDTNGCQFFITHAPTLHLDGVHSIFGEVYRGLEVVDSIANMDKSKDSIKTKNDEKDRAIIEKVRIIRVGKEAKAFDAPTVFKTYKEAELKEAEERKKAIEKVSEKYREAFTLGYGEAKALPSGLRIQVLKKGTGEKPSIKDRVSINYAGYIKETGMLFDTSWLDKAKEFNIVDKRRVAANAYSPIKTLFDPNAQLIPGFKEAMLTMSVGDLVRAFIPSQLAYGEKGAGNGVIPPNADLVFDIEIVEIVK